MSSFIYDDAVRRESARERVEMSPPEYLALQKFILDSRVEQYRDAESVLDLLDGIHDKHDVVTTMYELIFANAADMPNIQEFEGVDQCAQLLTDNFITDGTERKIAVPYGLAVNPANGDIFLTDARNYVSSGTLYCFSPEGKCKWSVRTGDIPSSIAFMEKGN